MSNVYFNILYYYYYYIIITNIIIGSKALINKIL